MREDRHFEPPDWTDSSCWVEVPLVHTYDGDQRALSLSSTYTQLS